MADALFLSRPVSLLHWRRWSWALWLGLCGLVGNSVAAPACPARPIRLALYETGFYLHNGVGLDKDVADELQRRSQCVFDVVTLPRIRIFSEMEAGRLDIITSVLPTPERNQTMWIANYLQLRYYAIISPSVAPQIHSLEDFIASATPLQWSVVKGFSYGPYFDPLLKKLAESGRVHEVSEPVYSYRMLAANRVAGTLSSAMVYHLDLAEHGLTDIVRVEMWDRQPRPSPRGVGLSKLSFTPAEAKEWTKLIEAMNRDGTTKRLIGKYLPPNEAADAVFKP